MSEYPMTNREQPDTVRLGTSGLHVTPLGIGTWAWGDRLFWGFGRGYDEADVGAAFQTSLNAGINLFDTAEIYGWGRSEQLLGQFVRELGQPVVVATKFFPYPWRLRQGDLLRALRGSLDRLGLSQVDLYQIHWPNPPVSIETWMAGLPQARQPLRREADAVGAHHHGEAGVPRSAGQVVDILPQQQLAAGEDE